VTLIAAFRSPEGFAVCADSQGTVGDYRISRQKLIPETCGAFDIVIAGTGNNGELIDAFVERLLHDNLPRANVSTLPELKQFLGRELLDYDRHEIGHYPRSQRLMQFVVGARTRGDGTYAIWRTQGSRVLEVRDFTVVGWEEPLYSAIAKRLYKQNLTLEQAELAAMYVLIIAEETSNYVHGPMSAAVIRQSGMRIEAPNRVLDMSQRLRDFEIATNNLFLACAENTPQPILEKKLDEFRQQATQLHRFSGLMVSKVVVYVALQAPDNKNH